MSADQLVVDKLLAGTTEFYSAHPADRRAAIEHLHEAEGLTLRQIARRFKCRPDTVETAYGRWQARRAAQAAAGERPSPVRLPRHRDGCPTRRLIEVAGLYW